MHIHVKKAPYIHQKYIMPDSMTLNDLLSNKKTLNIRPMLQKRKKTNPNHTLSY